MAVTFDDDYPSHRRIAMPTLVRSNVPATFFLCGASLDRPFSFWWELLQRAADRGVPADSILGDAGSPSRTIHEVAATLHAMDPEERAGVAARLESRLGPGSAGGGMSAEDVRALVEAGFEIGFHTLEHHPLTTLDDRALPEAMVKGKDRISQLAGRELSTIAYPYGEADGRVAAAARKAGFKIGYTTSGLPFRGGDRSASHRQAHAARLGGRLRAGGRADARSLLTLAMTTVTWGGPPRARGARC